jgi:tetratricopeptide (TPR) repeat protein
MDDLFKAAKDAMASKDYQRAVALYQEALNRDAVNPAALDGLSQARDALNRQMQENERNQRFLKEYQNAARSFQEQDYAECLRVAWRLIYPDDTLARQLGKRDAITSLIRDGYYNWTVMDLKQENVRGADKNLKDLLEFARDPDAVKLQGFVKKYLTQPIDDNYRDVVRNLDYRPLKEGP